MTDHPFLFALLSAAAVSLLSLIGLATLPLRGKRLNELTFVLISLATGALFGDAAFHLLPDIFQNTSHRLVGSLWILVGIFCSFSFEKFLRWKQSHGLESHSHGHPPSHSHHSIKPVGRIILVSDGLHNFMDGILIGASYLAGPKVGVATTMAVLLHELPHEIGDFAVLVDAGYEWGEALLFNFLSACVSITGVLAAFGFHAGMGNFTEIALPLTAGSFIYIAGANLTPELHKEEDPKRSVIQCGGMLVGMALMLLLLWVD